VTRPPAGFGDPTCSHVERDDGVCVRCGNCAHEIILNGACFVCGSTDLDPIAMSPKKPAPLIAAGDLVRKAKP
jgi:hypothetical protein